MKPSPDAVVNAFNKLNTPELRHKRRIWALVARLTQEELDGLRTWSHNEIFYRDPIHVLPIELLSRIFQLDYYNHGVVAVKQATLYSRDTPAPIASAMAAHFDAFCTGDPFAMTSQLRDHYVKYGYGSQQATAAYCGGLLAWSEDLVYTTNLLCLRTGRTKLWANEGESKAHCIAVSELFIATCDQLGNVSVYNHLTDDIYTLKLSSANVRGFVLKRATLAILFDREIVVWSLNTQKTRQIPIISDNMRSISCANNRQETFGLHFAANGRDFICSRAIMDDTVSRTAFSTGNSASSGKIFFTRVPSDGTPRRISTSHEISSSCESICRTTCHMDPSGLHTFGTIICNSKAILIGYDEVWNQPQFHVLGPLYRNRHPNGYFRKHVLYKSEFSGLPKAVCRKILFKDLHDHHDQRNTTWKTTDMDGDAVVKSNRKSHASYAVLGDETFLVHMYPTHIMAYCFDQNSEGGFSWTKLRPSPIPRKK
ncbi:hypothetical protein MMC18_008862 [Xylographa bjoerkii]|nr:hypothetical protein [Xylographa bjoerkii]